MLTNTNKNDDETQYKKEITYENLYFCFVLPNFFPLAVIWFEEYVFIGSACSIQHGRHIPLRGHHSNALHLSKIHSGSDSEERRNGRSLERDAVDGSTM